MQNWQRGPSFGILCMPFAHLTILSRKRKRCLGPSSPSTTTLGCTVLITCAAASIESANSSISTFTSRLKQAWLHRCWEWSARASASLSFPATSAISLGTWALWSLKFEVPKSIRWSFGWGNVPPPVHRSQPLRCLNALNSNWRSANSCATSRRAVPSASTTRGQVGRDAGVPHHLHEQRRCAHSQHARERQDAGLHHLRERDHGHYAGIADGPANAPPVGPVACTDMQPTGGTGPVSWAFTGTVESGGMGMVLFQAKVD